MKTQLVEVVIPMYRAQLSPLERRALEQVYRVLHLYPLTIVKPLSLDVSAILAEFPALQVASFGDTFFDGIRGYNKLMLSPSFYARFLHATYLLVYQLDAFVFADELSYWCDRGFDYVGAPWLKKPVYDLPVVTWVMGLCRWFDALNGRKNKQMLYDKVGNGGFSLRKVARFYEVAVKQQDAIGVFLLQSGHLYNEDVFWAFVDGFSYPQAHDALGFAFDKYPALCYRLNQGRLPFGCHGWYKRKMMSFWKPVIGF